MSNDWWTPSTSFHTPQRPSSIPHSSSQNQLAHSHRRFVGDELDPEDSKMADNIKFLPSFASSPAGKLALGTSPQALGAPGTGSGGGPFGGQSGFGLGSSIGQSPQDRKSPTANARFSISAQDRDSPRHTRTRTLVHQNSGLGSMSINVNAMDEDMPPTASLRDSVAEPSRAQDVSTPAELPVPPSLIPSSSTTTLHIFGPPLEILATLQTYLSQFGQITSYRAGPEGSNWYIVDFSTPLAASYALRRHGDIINGRYMLGFKVAQPGSTAGCTLVDGGHVSRTSAGTSIRVQNASIIKQRPNPQPADKVNNNNDYAWDEPEGQNGWSSWVSERLFGR